MTNKPRIIWAFAHTPFQVICVAELCQYLGRGSHADEVSSNLLILGTPRANTTSASRNVARAASLNHGVVKIPWMVPKIIASVVYLLICRWKLRKAVRGDILVVGTGMHFRYVDLLARSKDLERWIVDDGTSTINLLTNLDLDRNPLRGVDWNKPGYRFFVRRVLRVKEPRWEEVHWFTVFYPEFRHLPNIKHNRLNLMKALGGPAKVRNEIWFMGAPLIQAGIASAPVFAQWIREICYKMRSQYPGKRLRYVLHPDEKSQYRKYTKVYEKFDECMEFGEPIESVVRSSEFVPKVVVSILSTSILTMRELLPVESRVVVFLPDLRDISSQQVSHIKPIMEFLSKFCRNREIQVREVGGDSSVRKALEC